jgi:glycerol kinase
MQFQSDILGVPVIRPKVYETTAIGAAYLAGLAIGYWDSIPEIQKQWQEDKAFKPAMEQEQVARLIKGWKRAVKASIAWADDK